MPARNPWLDEAVARREAEAVRLTASDEHDLAAHRFWRAFESRLIWTELQECARKHGRDVPQAHSLSRRVQERQLQRLQASLGPRDPAWVGRWRTHVERLAQDLGVSISWSSVVVGVGSAWSKAGRVLLPRISSAGTVATAWHELGHVACSREGHVHREAPSDGLSFVSPLAECCAWEFAKRVAIPRWTAEMQSELAWALSTYLRFAAPHEARTMRALIQSRGGSDV